MKVRTLLLAPLLLLFPVVMRGQSITQQLTDQVVLSPATATFTVVVSGGPCRSAWIVNGVEHFGEMASTISYSIPSTSADYKTGTKVQAQLYGCAGGPAKSQSVTATLTVNNFNVNLSIVNDDGTVPAVQMLISKVNTDGSTTAALALATDANGNASGGLLYDKTQIYAVAFTVDGAEISQLIPAPLFSMVYPNASSVTVAIVLKAGATTIQKSTVTVQ